MTIYWVSKGIWSDRKAKVKKRGRTFKEKMWRVREKELKGRRRRRSGR
jgi:hypothetical protein